MTSIELYRISLYLGYSLLMARSVLLLTFIYNGKSVLRSKPHKLLLIYSIIAVITAVFEAFFVFLVNQFKEFFIPILKKLEISDTFFISPFYFLDEFLFVGLAFAFAVKAQLKKILISVSLVCFFAEIINTIWLEGYKNSQTFGSLGLSLFNIFISLLYLKEFLKTKNQKNSLKDSFFIISISILIPYTFSVLLYVTTKSLFEENYILFQKLQFFRISLEGLCLLLMAYGVSLVKKYTKP